MLPLKQVNRNKLTLKKRMKVESFNVDDKGAGFENRS
jgi:hypothetical protein